MSVWQALTLVDNKIFLTKRGGKITRLDTREHIEPDRIGEQYLTNKEVGRAVQSEMFWIKLTAA